MTAPRVTLSGYYGFGNAGDEAVLAGLVQSLRAARGDWEIAVLSGAPAQTEAAHGIRAVHRFQPAALLRALARTDLLLSGGGSLLQDVTSAHGIFYYLGVVRLAQLMGKKTMFIAQGVGPLYLPRSRKLVASVANRLDAVTVRDPDSAELLRAIGVSRPPLEVTADPALLLEPSLPFPPVDAFAVALRPWKNEGLPEVVADACRRALPPTPARLVSMQPQGDTLPSEQFSRRWHQETVTWSGAAIDAFAACQIVVGMRLHALILAAACGVPSVALSYDPKVTAFMRQSGQEDAVWDSETGDRDTLTEMLARVWETRTARADALRARLPRLRALAQRNAGRAAELTSPPGPLPS